MPRCVKGLLESLFRSSGLPIAQVNDIHYLTLLACESTPSSFQSHRRHLKGVYIPTPSSLPQLFQLSFKTNTKPTKPTRTAIAAKIINAHNITHTHPWTHTHSKIEKQGKNKAYTRHSPEVNIQHLSPITPQKYLKDATKREPIVKTAAFEK